MRHHEQQGPAAGDEDAAARQDGRPLHQVLGATRGHDPGQGPPGERHGPIVGARRQHQGLGTDLLGAIVRGDGDRALVEDPPGGRAQPQLDAERLHLGDERAARFGLAGEHRAGGRAEPRGHLAIVLATERGIVVDQRHADAVACRRARGGEAGRAPADDQAGDVAHGLTRQSPSPRWLSTRMPSRAGVTHARTLGSPSTVTRQSWQTPIPQK